MKVYSIGREVGCDIVINDNSDVISRRHAILNVLPSGKMTITDQSHNGTYVNGIRISQNVPVPVTRKDNISFAHVARLDWDQIPKPKSVLLYVIIGIAALALIIGGIFAYKYFVTPEPKPVDQPVIEQKTDTTSVKKEDAKDIKQKEGSDSAKQKKPIVKPKTVTKQKPKEEEKTKKEEKKKEEDKKPRGRVS